MSTEPIYRRVFQDLAARIDSGDLKGGDKIPSTAALSLEYNCSSTAINTAIVLLISRGYVYGQPGIGRFVTDRS